MTRRGVSKEVFSSDAAFFSGDSAFWERGVARFCRFSPDFLSGNFFSKIFVFLLTFGAAFGKRTLSSEIGAVRRI